MQFSYLIDRGTSNVHKMSAEAAVQRLNALDLLCRHLETLRHLASALGPLLQQFIADTRLYQDTSVFVDETIAQCMVSGRVESMEDSDSCDADFLQYDLGTYEGKPWTKETLIQACHVAFVDYL